MYNCLIVTGLLVVYYRLIVTGVPTGCVQLSDCYRSAGCVLYCLIVTGVCLVTAVLVVY